MPKFNCSQKLTDLFGRPFPKTNPSKEEYRALESHPKVKNRMGQDVLDQSYLPDETLGNFLISCLAAYEPETKTDNFYIQIIAASLLSAQGEVELKDMYYNFLLEVMDEVTQRVEKVKRSTPDGKQIEVDEDKGMYMPWAVTKAKILMGETLPAEEEK